MSFDDSTSKGKQEEEIRQEGHDIDFKKQVIFFFLKCFCTTRLQEKKLYKTSFHYWTVLFWLRIKKNHKSNDHLNFS